MFKITKAEKLTSNIYLMDVLAPRVAKSCKPGQFIIVRLDETAERIPLTICDYDAEAGTVTIVFQPIGASTQKMTSLKEGDAFMDFVGPLGCPSELCDEDVEELKNRAGIYSSLKEWMEFVKLEEDMEDDTLRDIKNKDALIKLYTFHGSKGLEFHKVIIPHLNEGSVPYKKELSQDALEEERRMFYVALTRSSSDLMITFVQNDTKKDTVSRFLKECALTVSK